MYYLFYTYDEEIRQEAGKIMDRVINTGERIGDIIVTLKSGKAFRLVRAGKDDVAYHVYRIVNNKILLFFDICIPYQKTKDWKYLLKMNYNIA
tara:strand:- start:1436 stop:1714 length:279 start_codon:yes stop_codon:yes gene_type:complete